MLCALIMAGGKGTRFWPLSTEKKPKQFLNLLGEDTMIQMTVKRLLPLIPYDRIFVVTGKEYKAITLEQLPDLPEDNIILEPYGRNTAPCIVLSAFYINKRYKNATLAVLPSDHMIRNDDKFLKAITDGEKFADENKDAIVTLGIRPDRPETGYGYIKTMESRNCDINSNRICRVERFVEKPGEEKAKEYIQAGNYLWNAGMFIWNTDTILNLTKRYLYNTYETIAEIAADSDNYETTLEEKYIKAERISIDYAVMEKHKEIYVIPADFGWDDVGSWKAVERYGNKDEDGNVCFGNVKGVNFKNNIIIGSKYKTVVTNMDDIYVIENEDTIFIGKKSEVNNLKDYKKQLEA